MAKPKILTSADFASFVSTPLSLNGSVSWECEWLIDKLILKGGFNIIGGAPKVGKSLLRSHLLISAIAGSPAFGCFKAERAQKALLMAGEEALEVEEARLRRAARAIEVPEGTLPVQIMPQYGFFFNDAASFANFRSWAVAEGFDLVVIDPLIRWHRSNENASGELSPILADLRTLCHYGMTVIVIHHTGKPKEDASEDMPLGYYLRGTTDLAAIYDQLIIMKGKKGRSKSARRLLVDSRPAESLDPLEVDLIFGADSYTFDVRIPTRTLVLEAVQMFGPISGTKVRENVHRSKEQVGLELKILKRQGLIEETCDGWITTNDD